MQIARWRLVLTGAVVVALGIAAVGVATAATSAGAVSQPAADGTPATDALALDDAAPDEAVPGRGRPLARLAAARHLVHLELRVVDRAGEIVEHHLDHGTIQSIGGGSLVVREADDGTVTIATNDETRVRLGRQRGSLADLAVGDEVVVHSRIDDGAVVARQIIRLPAPAS